MNPRRFVFLGLSITSSWGNGHATTYRALLRALSERGHHVTFLERDVPWYAENRDAPSPPYCETVLYRDVNDLGRFLGHVRDADVVVVGSFVPDGLAVSDWVTRNARGVTAFYDIDTPVTLRKLERGDHAYLAPEMVPKFDLYLSFTGGPLLEWIESRWGARAARALYCSFDPALYRPEPAERRWDLGYLGTYSPDRQPTVERLLLEPSRQWREGRFVVAGAQYPDELQWPANVERRAHVSPHDHCAFYNAQRFTLNVTRADMIAAGYSPSVRLFEAAGCGVPIISDAWTGLDTVFEPGREVLIARTPADVLALVRELPESERAAIGARARERVLRSHTAAHRAVTLETYVDEIDRGLRNVEYERRTTWRGSL
jgi:spore maturation protein CgeB